LNLLESTQARLSDESLSRLAASVGRPPEEVRSIASLAVPVLLSAISNLVLDEPSRRSLLGAIRGGTGAGAIHLASLGALDLRGLAELVASQVGGEAPAVGTILDELGAIVLDVLGARLREAGGVDEARLTHLFASEKPAIARALPNGLALSALPTIPGVPTQAPAESASPRGASAWLLPGLAAALIALAALLAWKWPVEDAAPALPGRSQAARGTTQPPPPPPIEKSRDESGD